MLKVHSVCASPTLSLSERCFSDGLSYTSDQFYSSTSFFSNTHGIIDNSPRKLLIVCLNWWQVRKWYEGEDNFNEKCVESCYFLKTEMVKKGVEIPSFFLLNLWDLLSGNLEIYEG